MDSRIKKLFDIEYSKIYGNTILIDFSKEWHKYVINYDELGAEIVDLASEGIPQPNPIAKKALKIKVGAGETKYLTFNIPGVYEEQNLCILMYLTGDVTAEALTGWTGTRAKMNVRNTWKFLFTRYNSWSNGAIQFTATNGGEAYICLISFYKAPYNVSYQSYPNVSLDGSSTLYYYAILPAHGFRDGVARAYCHISGDGTNACNVSIQVFCATDNTYHTIATFSNISTNLSIANIKFPYRMFSEPQNDIQFVNVRFVVSGYGTFYDYGLVLWKYDKLSLNIGGLKTGSASNTSTTVTNYTLLDTNGRGNRYKQASVSLSSPSGGTAKLYINGQLAADFSGTSGTFTIPDDIDIWKITVDLAGDGTTAATAEFKGLELLGPYIVRR